MKVKLDVWPPDLNDSEEGEPPRRGRSSSLLSTDSAECLGTERFRESDGSPQQGLVQGCRCRGYDRHPLKSGRSTLEREVNEER